MIELQQSLDNAEDLMDALLAGTVGALDIPSGLAASAVAEYEGVARWLARRGDIDGASDWDIYPQGSFRLGTVVRPLSGGGEFDIDLVCRLAVEKMATSQADLKAKVGAELLGYVTDARRRGLATKCTEGQRCWTLVRDETFHMDVLPAIPDPDGSATGILLTDRELLRWQYSDPIAYAEWFKDQMRQELVRKQAMLAEVRKSTVEQVPWYDVKTILQQSVQVLKRHRDIYFEKDPDNRPPSILITTLAAHAYSGDQHLYRAVIQSAEAMKVAVLKSNGVWSVPNPVQPNENFADKWAMHPERALRFFAWLDALAQDLTAAKEGSGLQTVARRLKESFGESPVEKAATSLGDMFRTKRERGELGMLSGSAGLVSGSAARTVPRHNFFGEEAAES